MQCAQKTAQKVVTIDDCFIIVNLLYYHCQEGTTTNKKKEGQDNDKDADGSLRECKEDFR